MFCIYTLRREPILFCVLFDIFCSYDFGAPYILYTVLYEAQHPQGTPPHPGIDLEGRGGGGFGCNHILITTSMSFGRPLPWKTTPLERPHFSCTDACNTNPIHSFICRPYTKGTWELVGYFLKFIQYSAWFYWQSHTMNALSGAEKSPSYIFSLPKHELVWKWGWEVGEGKDWGRTREGRVLVIAISLPKLPPMVILQVLKLQSSNWWQGNGFQYQLTNLTQ